METQQALALLHCASDLRRLADYFCPPKPGEPSPFEEALAKIASGKPPR